MIKEITTKDFDVCGQFLSKYSGQKFDKDKYVKDFYYWWIENPSISCDDAFGWMIVDENENDYVKGFLGNIPIEYNFDNKTIKTYNASTWYVDDNYKKEAVNLAYAYFMQGKDFLLNSTPSEFTEKIFLKLGCIDYSTTQQTYIKPLTSRIFSYYIEKFISSKLIVSILSDIISVILKSANVFSQKYYRLSIKEVDTHESLKIDKNKVYIKNLEWLLKDKDKKLLIIEQNTEYKGYIIIQYVYNIVNDLRYIQILDYQGVELSHINFLSKEIKDFFKANVDFILFSNYDDIYKYESGFVNITSKMRPITLLKSSINLENIRISSIFGEKGIIIWH